MAGMLGERGVALATALVLTLTIVVLGTGLLLSSRGAQRTETGFKNQQRTFETAVAGLEWGREVVRQNIFDPATAGTVSYDTMLTTAAGADGALVDSSSLANFAVANGVATIDDVPVLANENLGGVTYNVYLTNDPWDGIDNENDDDDTGPGDPGQGKHVVTLTSIARGMNGEGFAAVQGIYRGQLPFTLPQLPGVVTLPGPAIDFSKGSSAVINGAGGDPPCFAAIATSRQTATSAAITEITTSPNRNTSYTTCNPNGAGTWNANGGAVQSFINTGAYGPNPYAPGESNTPTTTPPGNGALNGVVNGCAGDDRDLLRVGCLNGLINSINGQRLLVGGYRGAAPTDAQLGSLTDPRIAIVDGNLTRNGGEASRASLSSRATSRWVVRPATPERSSSSAMVERASTATRWFAAAFSLPTRSTTTTTAGTTSPTKRPAPRRSRRDGSAGRATTTMAAAMAPWASAPMR